MRTSRSSRRTASVESEFKSPPNRTPTWQASRRPRVPPSGISGLFPTGAPPPCIGPAAGLPAGIDALPFGINSTDIGRAAMPPSGIEAFSAPPSGIDSSTVAPSGIGATGSPPSRRHASVSFSTSASSALA